MRVIIQRVKQAQVKIDSEIVGQIKQGVLIFLGVAKQDSYLQADHLIKKIIELRIFEDKEGKMNLSNIDLSSF